MHGRTRIAPCKFERSESSERERPHLRVRLRQNRYKTARETQDGGLRGTRIFAPSNHQDGALEALMFSVVPHFS
jgi:hypothetical protein